MFCAASTCKRWNSRQPERKNALKRTGINWLSAASLPLHPEVRGLWSDYTDALEFSCHGACGGRIVPAVTEMIAPYRSHWQVLAKVNEGELS
jgi:hypothetical protein